MTLRKDRNDLHNRQARRARALSIEDPDLAFCWYCVVDSLDSGLVSIEALRTVIRAGGSHTGNDFDITREGERLVIGHPDGEGTCECSVLAGLLDQIEQDPGDDDGPATTLEDFVERLGALLGVELRDVLGPDTDAFVARASEAVSGMSSSDPATRQAAGDLVKDLGAELASRGVERAEGLGDMSDALEAAAQSN